MALTLLMKTIGLVATLSILTNLSGAAPFNTTVTTVIERDATNIGVLITTFATSTVIGNAILSATSTNSSSWHYIATQFPPSATSTHDHSIYTLADTTGEDLPSAIPLNGIKIGPLATFFD
jgi:hypothetical protein